ncbi:hypothetical protein MY10362_000550 [Beauveria mimosiformis]
MVALLHSFGLTRTGYVAGAREVYGVSRRPGAGLALKRLKFKALQPSRADQDPYIWALLIALAQAHKKLAPDAPRWKVLLLAGPGPGARQLYCYQGWVPAPLLRRLDELSAKVACPAVAIRVSTISLEAPRDAARCIWEVLHEAELVLKDEEEGEGAGSRLMRREEEEEEEAAA